MQGGELLNRRVVTGGIELGRVVDVILDEDGDRELGLVVRCGDGEHRFLPMAAVEVRGEDVATQSAFMLLETEQLDFYRSRGRALRS